MSDQATARQQRTPSETLINCLENFGTDEPDAVMVVWTTRSGDIAWSSSTDRMSLKVGMLELAKAHILELAKSL